MEVALRIEPAIVNRILTVRTIMIALGTTWTFRIVTLTAVQVKITGMCEESASSGVGAFSFGSI